jgi:hypothetical protein
MLCAVNAAAAGRLRMMLSQRRVSCSCRSKLLLFSWQKLQHLLDCCCSHGWLEAFWTALFVEWLHQSAVVSWRKQQLAVVALLGSAAARGWLPWCGLFVAAGQTKDLHLWLFAGNSQLQQSAAKHSLWRPAYCSC